MHRNVVQDPTRPGWYSQASPKRHSQCHYAVFRYEDQYAAHANHGAMHTMQPKVDGLMSSPVSCVWAAGTWLLGPESKLVGGKRRRV